MTLERNPNSKNMFYVDPELFPITNEVEEAGNDKVYLDEETGKFIFEFPTLYKVWIPVDLGEDISNKRFILWVEKGIAQSAWSFTTIIEGTSVQTIDPNFSDFLIDTPSGERFYGYYVETESHGSSGEITFLVHPDTDFGSSPLGMALTHDDYVMSEWQSAYREAKIDLDPALSSKLITVGQLARLKGSGTASGALSSKLITVGQLARLMGKAAPPDNQKGKLVTLSQLKRVSTVKIVSWADGTDEEIAAMVAAADAGQITLSDYWHEGDTRTVHLSAMPGSVSNANESHAAQDVQFVLSDPGHFTLANGQPCNFVVNMKDCLKKYGYMNSSKTNSGGWNGCARRTWCNNVFRNAIPSGLRPAFKQFKTKAATGTGTASTTSTDWFALPSEMEVFGRVTYANSSAESGNTQLNYYKTSSNRVKKVNGGAVWWWERSPDSSSSTHFCMVNSRGSAHRFSASYGYGLSPFGCI